jgi:hypothetical protein
MLVKYVADRLVASTDKLSSVGLVGYIESIKYHTPHFEKYESKVDPDGKGISV